MHRSFLAFLGLGGLACLLLLSGKAAQARPRERRATPAVEVRLVEVGAQGRTKGKKGGWTEALPGQALGVRSQVETGLFEGAEISLGERGRLRLGPATLVAIERPPGGRSAGTLRLLRGSLRAEVPEDGPPLSLRAESARIHLRGVAYVEAQERESAVAVHGGVARVKGRGKELRLAAGQGVRLVGRARPEAQALPAAPSWEQPGPQLVLARGALGKEPVEAAAALAFSAVTGAERYLVEVALDGRFNQPRLRGEITAPPYRARLAPASYHARVSALSAARLPGPSSAAASLRVIAVRSDAELDPRHKAEASALWFRRALQAALEVSGGGAPLLARLDGGPEVDCRTGGSFSLGPGDHRLELVADGARGELHVAVSPPEKVVPPPPPPPPVVGPAPLGLPVSLSAPGFPTRALHPRTRAFALLGVGGSGPGRSADVYRLDLGGELAFFRNSFSVDLDLPVLYQRPERSDEVGRFALGDVQLGFRAVALRLFQGRLALGPLLRLQLPTGTFERKDAPGGHPLVIDPAVALAGVLGPVALLTTQGPTAVLAVSNPALRWSMSYAAELRLGWLGVLGEFDAALGLGAASSGAALGGGLRARLPGAAGAVDGRRGYWSLLAGARGGLGDPGETLFGRYQVSLGVEWRLR